MKALKTFFLLLLFLVCLNMLGQTTKTITVETELITNPFWENLSIRKAFESNTSDDDKAALLSITSPKDLDEIFKINAGIGYTFANLGEKSNHDLTTFFVYNKNNQLDKEQENYKFGLTYTSLYVINANFSWLNDTSLEYLNDNAKKTQSLLALTYFHLLSNKQGNIKLGSYGLTNSIFAYQFNPKVGLEYQNDFNKTAPLETGNTLRSYFNIGGNIVLRKKTVIKETTITTIVDANGVNVEPPIAPTKIIKTLPKMLWKKGLELMVNYEGRNILSDSYKDTPNYRYFFKGEAKLYPIRDDNFYIGFSYNKGEDPIAGLDKQEFWMLSLSFKK